MTHGSQELAFGAVRLFGPLAGNHQLPLHQFALADIAHRGGHPRTLGRPDRTQADFDRELFPILAEPVQLQSDAHLAGASGSSIAFAMPRMADARARGNQNLDPLPEHFLALVAEHDLGLRIHQSAGSLPAGCHHGIRSGLHERAELFFALPDLLVALLAFGDVASDVGESSKPPRIVAHRGDGDLRPKPGAVFADSPALFLETAV